MPDLPCETAVPEIPGTGFNTYPSPSPFGSTFKNNNNKLLYEILQGINLLVAANPPAMTKIISFTVGEAGYPADGDVSLEVPILGGQSLVNVNIHVVREGVSLRYSDTDGSTVYDIRRYNHAGNGGFVFEAASGLSFVAGEHYDLYVVGANSTDQV